MAQAESRWCRDRAKASRTALIRFAVAGGANFLDPFKKNICPFVKNRFVNILRACGAQSLHLL